MINKTNINIIFTAILYTLYLIGVIMATQITPNNNSNILLNCFFVVHYLILIFIPITITISLIYLFKNKSLKNIITTIIAALSVSWVIVVLYIAGTVLSKF